jgi:hypothetical protein
MIEPDINEQMARFAPSQNPADPGFDAIEKAVAGMSGVPMPKPEPVDMDIDRAVQDIAAQRRQDMASSLMAASEVNPDEAAQADALGRRFGVGQDIALRNMSEMRRQAMIQDTERMDLLRKDPVLARYIADREFAAQASDDVGVLSMLRPMVLEAATLQTPGGFFRVVGRGYERGQIVSERGDIGAKAMAGFAEQGDFDRAKQLQDRMQQLGQQGLLGSAAEMIAQNVGQLRTIGTTAAGGAALGSIAGPVGTVTGGTLGAAAGIVIGTGTMEAGNLYLDMRDQGVSDDAAIPAAIAGGFLNGVIEVVGMKIASAPFKALASKVIREEVSKAIAQPTMRSALIAAGKAYGLQVGGEAAEEGLQEIVAIASEEIAKAADGIDSETSLREATGRVIEAFAYGGMASALLGGIGPGANLVVDLRRANATQRQQAFFNGLAENRKESKLAQRNPQGYERFLAAQAQDTPAETIYVDAATARDILAQSGTTTAQLEDILPGIRERLEKAVETGGDVTIPTSQFGARLANTELGNALLPHMRLSPEAMSATEAQAFEAQRQAVVEEARTILATKQEADAAFVAEAQQVEDEAFKQVRSVGQFTDIEARTIAKLRQAMVVVDAAEAGMTPAQYQRERGVPLQVRGVQGEVAPVATFKQAAAVDKFGVATPQYRRAWHKATTGSPITVTAWHAPGGSNAAKLTEFARERMGRETTLGGGWYGARDKDVAQTYGAPKEFQVTLQNPYVFSEASKSFVLKITNEELQRLRDAGHDGIIVKGVNSTLQGQDRSHLEVIAFNPEAAVQEVTAPFDQAATLDADYLAAVERGDMATAQRMVEEAAWMAGYKVGPLFHGGITKIDVPRGVRGIAASASLDRSTAEYYARTMEDAYLRGEAILPEGAQVIGPNISTWYGRGEIFDPRNPAHVQRAGLSGLDLPFTWETYELDFAGGMSDVARAIRDAGFSGYFERESVSDYFRNIGFFSPNDIKSADPVTRDDAGNIVPLSRRFDITSPKVFEQAAQPGAARVLGPIEAAKKLVQETGRESFIDADEFFQKRWDALLKQTGRQLEPTSSNFAEAAKRAVSDILDFVKNNPKFADYYANDWRVTRAILDDYVGRPITDDEFALYRTIAGLTSPNTMLPSNISDTVGLWNHWMRFRNFDAFTLGPKPLTGALVVFEAAEPISGTTANIKVRTLKIIERLIKERGGVTQALQYLQEGVPVKELHKFNRKMGYAGNATDIGNITDLVMQATGQDKLIPRMFIFGQKVGAYTLNAVGDERYTTVDIWESRYIRSHFLGMFDKNIGLPESTEEHQIFTRFGDLFKQEMEAVTGRKWAPSALQALRWFYIIGSSREAGYSKASTNETISFYTERQLTQAFGYSPSRAAGGGSGAGAVAAGSGAGKVLGGRIEPKRFERDLSKDVNKLADAKLERKAIAAGYVRFARHNSELGAGGFSFVERRLASPGRHGTLTSATVAAEFTAGSRLRTAFEKAELPIPVMQELVADENGAEAFRSLVVQTNESNPHGAAVAAYTADEYQQKRLFVTADGTAGFALTTDGDIVSVFSAPGSGNGRAVMALAVQVGGTRLDCFDTVLPSYYAAHGFRAVARLPWNDEYAPVGWDAKAFAAYNNGKPDVVFMVYEPGYTGEYKAGAGASVSEYGDGVAAQTSELNAIAKRRVFEQAAAGPARGGFDPRTLNVLVGKGGDVSTLAHELIHLRVAEYLRMARGTTPPARVNADLETLFDFMGVEGATFQERLDNYETMTIDQRRPLEEKVTYNFEIYLYEGKAPSVELRGVFDRLAAWMRRVYKSIRDDLNAIYRREFGTDLPILTPEVRSVFDRMLASEEQIKRQEAIEGMKGLFQTQAESGMGDAEWAAYQAMQQEATEAAVTDLNTASMRQVQWLGNARARILRDLQKKHDAKRKEVTAEVAAAVKVEPVYRAMTYLRYGRFVDTDGAEVEVEGTHRLDIEKVRAMYASLPSAEGVELIRATGMAVPANVRPDITPLGTGKYGMLGREGLDPDVVAEMFGYGSGDEMVRALLAAKPMKDAVAERTDAEMLRRFGDMNTPAALEAEVQKALHNEARARFVAVELRHIAKATQPVRVMLEAAKQVAADMISDMTVRDVRPSEFVAAEARAARDATQINSSRDPVAAGRAAYTRAYNEAAAVGAPEDVRVAGALAAQADAVQKAQARIDELRKRYGADPQQALIRAKRAQLYQNQLAAEALRVKEYVDKQVKYLRGVMRDSNVKRMGAAAADQVAGLLERFEVAPVSLKRLDERRSMAKYLADLEDAGVVPDIAEEIADEARRVNYKQLKVSEFRDLVDAVKQIEHIGKNEQKMRLAEERAAFEEVRDDVVTRIRAVGKVRELQINPRTPLTGIGRTAAFLRGFAAQHLKAASIARILDGGKEDGPLWNAIIRTANDASDMETRMRAEASLKLGEILKPVFALGSMGGKGMFFPSIGRSLNREARIAIALNLGNDGNRQRLLDGEGWTLEQLQPVLESLTEAEWLAVQKVWDFIDGYRPEIAAKERRLYGKEPEWVKPTPFTVRTSDGKEVALQGGYYPVKYDPVASDRVATVDAAEEAKRDLQGAYTAATTRRSFVKARAKEVRDRPLLYTLDAAFSGVNDVIHDLSWHEWLISTNRLLRDTQFANAVRETRGPEFLKQLRDWSKDNATGARGQQVAGEAALSWLRRNISASGLGFNVVSAAMQITGFNQSIVRIGAKYVGQGIVQFSTSPFESAKTVAEKSSFMAERGRTQFREINEIKNRVRGQTEVARRVTAGTYFLMMNMQRSVDIPTWLGAYQKALDAGKDDAKAVALADQAVRDSQGSGLVSDLSAMERGGPAMKLFTVFYSYMNTVYNMTAVQTMTARGKGKLAADYAMLLVVPVVLGYAIKSAIQPDAGDDELDPEALARKLAAEELSYLMGTMVIAREFGGAAQLLTGAEGPRMGYGGPAGLRAVGEVYGLATQAGQLEFDRAFRRSAINTLGVFTGLPSAQINRTIDGIEALVEGEVEGPSAVLAPLTGVQR